MKENPGVEVLPTPSSQFHLLISDSSLSSDLHPEDSQVYLFTFCQFHTPRLFPNLGPSFSFFWVQIAQCLDYNLSLYIHSTTSPVDSNLHPLIYFN